SEEDTSVVELSEGSVRATNLVDGTGIVLDRGRIRSLGLRDGEEMIITKNTIQGIGHRGMRLLSSDELWIDGRGGVLVTGSTIMGSSLRIDHRIYSDAYDINPSTNSRHIYVRPASDGELRVTSTE